MGFTRKFHYFLLNLWMDSKAIFKAEKISFAYLLENPSDPEQRAEIGFYLLLHGGYLTRCKEGDQQYRIPNKEIRDEFTDKMRDYISSLPFENNAISDLLNATLSENFEKFGEEITKSFYTLYEDRKTKEKLPNESSIHALMLAYLERLTQEREYVVIHEAGAFPESDSKEKGYRMDFHLQPSKGEKKTPYIIEVKIHDKDDESISAKALIGLLQIHEFNYYRHIKLSGETTSIILMGLAAHYDNICLVTQKVQVLAQEIFQAGCIRLQRFKIAGKNENEIEVVHKKAKELELKQSNSIEESNFETPDNEHGEKQRGIVEQNCIDSIKDLIDEFKKSAKEKNKNSEGVWIKKKEDEIE
jgi:hypothetical protein